MSLSERLKYAREKTRLTGLQVKERIDIGESTLSDFENGRREPKMSQLQKLAKLYHRSLSFFFDETPLQTEHVFWREEPEDEAAAIEAQFLRLCQQYHHLEVWLDDKLPDCLPTAHGNADTFSYLEAEALAKKVRDVLRLGDRPGPVLLSVLEEVCGIKIFHLEFEPSGAAASTRSDTFGPAILLNSKNVRWRRNFDLAHELFHLITWNIFRSPADVVALSTNLSKKEEKLANCFAGNLLMPEETVKVAISQKVKGENISYEALFDIARQFDVSIQALIWRLHNLYRQSAEGDARTRIEIQHAEQLNPQFDNRENTKPSLYPERYRALAVEALRRGEISKGRFAEYLGISRNEAVKYEEKEEFEYEEIRISPA